MISLFEKRLKRMKSELTALKTAHQRGLGTIRFFSKSASFNSGNTNGFSCRATILSGEPEWPLFSVFVSGTVGRNGITNVYGASQTATTMTFSISCAKNQDITVTVISSSQIQEVVRA